MADITLTSSMRANLEALRMISGQMGRVQNRLSTGLKVNSAIDNASSYYQARSLTNRAADLSLLLDAMGQGIETINAADEGIEQGLKFLEQMKSVAEQAISGTKDETDDGSEIAGEDYASYNKQYNTILEEYDKLLSDASYRGVNLLTGGRLNIVMNETRSYQFEVLGHDIRGRAIGLDEASWASSSDAEAALVNIKKAITTLREFLSEMGNNYQVVQTRQTFTDALINVLETGSDNLTLADMNEESSNYLALQTRQRLAVNSLSLAAQSALRLLKLF